MFNRYTPSNHYWMVGGVETRAYSSALPGFVPASDQAYQAWLEDGNMPTCIADLAELRDVLLVQYPAGWVPTCDEMKANKTADINASCAAAIVSGFTSSALGTPHTYDSALEDQLNLIGAVGLGIDLPYRCTDASGVKEFRAHTAAQLKQVATDGTAIKLAALSKAAALKAQVMAAVDVAAVEAVVW